MPALAIAEDLAVLEYGVGQFDPRFPSFSIQKFRLHSAPERFDPGVVITIADRSHRRNQPQVMPQAGERPRRELHSVVRVNECAGCRDSMELFPVTFPRKRALPEEPSSTVITTAHNYEPADMQGGSGKEVRPIFPPSTDTRSFSEHVTQRQANHSHNNSVALQSLSRKLTQRTRTHVELQSADTGYSQANSTGRQDYPIYGSQATPVM